MEMKQIEIDAQEIFEAWKKGGISKAQEKHNSICESKKLVLWVEIALKEKALKLIRGN